MSAAGLQRVIVRMMFDPAFRDAVYGAPEQALAGAEVSEVERGWLVARDRRAYATDVTRQARALLALEEELPAACAWARAQGVMLEAFFGSGKFHGCVEGRGLMVLAFAEWLVANAGVEVGELARVEGEIARLRRSARAGTSVSTSTSTSTSTGTGTGTGTGLRLGRRVRVVRVRVGVLEMWAAAREGRVEGGVGEVEVEVLLERGEDGGCTGEVLESGLAAVLRVAAGGVERGQVVEEVVRQGGERAEAEEIVDGLMASGVLEGA